MSQDNNVNIITPGGLASEDELRTLFGAEHDQLDDRALSSPYDGEDDTALMLALASEELPLVRDEVEQDVFLDAVARAGPRELDLPRHWRYAVKYASEEACAAVAEKLDQMEHYEAALAEKSAREEGVALEDVSPQAAPLACYFCGGDCGTEPMRVGEEVLRLPRALFARIVEACCGGEYDLGTSRPVSRYSMLYWMEKAGVACAPKPEPMSDDEPGTPTFEPEPAVPEPPPAPTKKRKPLKPRRKPGKKQGASGARKVSKPAICHICGKTPGVKRKLRIVGEGGEVKNVDVPNPVWEYCRRTRYGNSYNKTSPPMSEGEFALACQEFCKKKDVDRPCIYGKNPCH